MNKFEIEMLMKDHQELHSEFQIDNFIIGSQGDEWAQYKQCLREISGRLESIEGKKVEAKLLKLDISRIRFYLPTKYMREKIKIEKAEKVKRLKAIYDIISEYERELSRFTTHALKLKKQFGIINKEKRYQLEVESWLNKGRRMAAIDKITFGALTS